MTGAELTRRKELLVAQSHLHRLQARMAWHDVKQIVAPPHLAPPRGGHVRSLATTLVGIALPVFGLSRLGRIMRIISIGAMVMRVVRGLRRGH
jgi:MFS superfamily sulfate permease-like transporter